LASNPGYDAQKYIDQALAAGAKGLPDPIRKLAEVCGGASDEAWEWILQYLQKLRDKDDAVPSSGVELIAACLMSHLNLTEYGVSINYPWLTADGEAALAFLEEHGVSWQDNGQEWVDSTGVSWGA
jgi:hypothetical protein